MVDLNGAFNVGNRGMAEFIEVFKNEAGYLHPIITANQEKFISAPSRAGTGQCVSTRGHVLRPMRPNGRSSGVITRTRRYYGPTSEDLEQYGPPNRSGAEKLMEVREVDRDNSFIRRFLTEHLMRETDIFEYQQWADKRVVTYGSDERHWRQVRKTLLQDAGLMSMPVIKIEDADFPPRPRSSARARWP